jgi:pimeloyl-ACP methyl ester carboxylesterase
MTERITLAAAKAWQTAGDYLDWKGQRIFLRRGGDMHAPALLLLHGFPTSSLDWLPLWDDLTHDHWLLAPDFLGFGYSSKPVDFNYSINVQADLAEDMAIRSGARNVHIIAHDYGVSVAQELLARMHENNRRLRVLSCCFLNGGLIANAHRPRPIQKLMAGRFGPLLSRFMTKARFAKSFCEIFGQKTQPTAEELDAYWYVISQQDGHKLSHKLLHYMTDRRAKAARWSGVLSGVAAPLALINGSADPVSGAHLADAVAALNPALPITRLEGIGHYPQVEAPAAVLAAYRNLRGNSASRADVE